MKRLLFLLSVALALTMAACSPKGEFKGNRAEAIAAQIHNPKSDYVVVTVPRFSSPGSPKPTSTLRWTVCGNWPIPR